jgi:heptosyltransferase-2
VGIFGSTNPDRTGPLGPRTHVLWHQLDCTPCLQRTCRFGHYNCLKETTPEHAIEALTSLGVLC